MKDKSKFLCHNIKVMYIKCRQLLRWRLIIITSSRVGQTISAADNYVYSYNFLLLSCSLSIMHLTLVLNVVIKSK